MSLLNIFKNGVYIIGASDEDSINAMTASLVIPASFEPPCLTVAFDKKRYTKEMIVKTGRFSVSVLAEDQVDIARRFGGESGRSKKKFSDFDAYTLADGLPVIESCSVWMICDYMGELSLGDHLVIGGEIVRFEKTERKPLVFDVDTFF